MSNTAMLDKLATLGPEIVMGIGACMCMATGLTRSPILRRLTAPVAAITLIVVAVMVIPQIVDPRYGDANNTVGVGVSFTAYVTCAVACVGFLLLMVAAGVPGRLHMTREAETAVTRGRPFEPGDMMRGEFFAFFLLSMVGVMLCAGASDLVWLFLSLELTSLPTYVLVATSRDKIDAQEAAVKYFFLGALAVGIFLYGFALIYGATGTTQLFAVPGAAEPSVQGVLANQGASPLLITGMILAVVGIAFKIAAVPMHFYVADVYQGATTPITAFLAFVPKTAGFVSIIVLLSVFGAAMPAPIVALLWVMAVATMTVGNVMGLLQSNVKRVLAYSSIAHSGYMLVGILAWTSGQGPTLGNGVAAVLFYLVAYGLATIGAFAVLGCLEARGQEGQSYDDIAGLSIRHPVFAAIMLLSVLSLIGLPPMVGFLGKIYLFGAAIEHGYVGLVVIAVLNSAVSAVYYLRIISACYFSPAEATTRTVFAPARWLAAAIAAILALVLGLAGNRLVEAAHRATQTQVKVSIAETTTHELR